MLTQFPFYSLQLGFFVHRPRLRLIISIALLHIVPKGSAKQRGGLSRAVARGDIAAG